MKNSLCRLDISQIIKLMVKLYKYVVQGEKGQSMEQLSVVTRRKHQPHQLISLQPNHLQLIWMCIFAYALIFIHIYLFDKYIHSICNAMQKVSSNSWVGVPYLNWEKKVEVCLGLKICNLFRHPSPTLICMVLY